MTVSEDKNLYAVGSHSCVTLVDCRKKLCQPVPTKPRERGTFQGMATPISFVFSQTFFLMKIFANSFAHTLYLSFCLSVSFICTHAHISCSPKHDLQQRHNVQHVRGGNLQIELLATYLLNMKKKIITEWLYLACVCERACLCICAFTDLFLFSMTNQNPNTGYHPIECSASFIDEAPYHFCRHQISKLQTRHHHHWHRDGSSHVLRCTSGKVSGKPDGLSMSACCGFWMAGKQKF